MYSVTVDGLQGFCGQLTGTALSFVAVSVTLHHSFTVNGSLFVTVSVSVHVRITSTGMYSVTLSTLQGCLMHFPGTARMIVLISVTVHMTGIFWMSGTTLVFVTNSFSLMMIGTDLTFVKTSVSF